MRVLSFSCGARFAKLFLTLALGAVAIAGCGSSDSQGHERSARFAVQVLRASFPAKQAVARPSKLELEVHNPGPATVPNLTVSVHSFYYRSEYPNLADASRPIWIVDEGPGAIPERPVESVPFDSPGGDVTATEGTWAAGALAPGQTRTLIWSLTPVKAGAQTVSYAIAAGLAGKAKAQLQDGASAQGRFAVTIAPAPPVTHVNPETGLVEAGRVPVSPGP